jgi:NADH-quinone oxidoreductase subunit B
MELNEQLPVITPGEGTSQVVTQELTPGVQHHSVGSTFDIVVGPLDKMINWGRSNSAWPFGFGLCCCFIEFMSMISAKVDIARFGAEVARFSPRQSDVMIVSGTLTKKMAPAVLRLYQQMAEPKYVIAMGNCAVSGGIFSGGYSQVDGIDQIMPVDIYLPGCPPRPEALAHSIFELQKRMRQESIIRGRRNQPAIPPGNKVAHPWAATEQIFAKLYRRFFAEGATGPMPPPPVANASPPKPAPNPVEKPAVEAATVPASAVDKPAPEGATATGSGSASGVGPADDQPGMAPKGGAAETDPPAE